ncbi:MAG: hypothetical protein M3O35_07215 [Acidobacteriota bacterium]|nr:hypothetical protein [Acidobacteriota bacterium]
MIAFIHMHPGRPKAVVHVVIIVTAATLLTLNLFAWDVVFGEADPFLLKAIVFVAVMRAAVLWFFWKGKNWARIFLLVTAILGLLQVPAALNSGRGNWISVIPQLAANLFVWIWLNRLEVRKWYKPDYLQDFKGVWR